MLDPYIVYDNYALSNTVYGSLEGWNHKSKVPCYHFAMCMKCTKHMSLKRLSLWQDQDTFNTVGNCNEHYTETKGTLSTTLDA